MWKIILALMFLLACGDNLPAPSPDAGTPADAASDGSSSAEAAQNHAATLRAADNR